MHMRMRAAILVLVLIAPGLVSCIAVTSKMDVESSFDFSHTDPILRIFVVSGLDRINRTFASASHQILTKEAEDHGVTVKVYVPDDLQLEDDTETLLDAFGPFDPDVVLVLRVASLGWFYEGEISSATIDASLYDADDRERFWRGKFKIESLNKTGALKRNAADMFAPGLIDRMIEDGILSEKPPPKVIKDAT